jgi:pyridoxine/pyridoxamine 5'-phosphate oxidase
MSPERDRLVAEVAAALAAVERHRLDAIAANRNESVQSVPPCPLPDNKAGFRLYLSECWTGKHQPCPAGWTEFCAYLDAVGAWSSARYRLDSFTRRPQAKETLA